METGQCSAIILVELSKVLTDEATTAGDQQFHGDCRPSVSQELWRPVRTPRRLARRLNALTSALVVGLHNGEYLLCFVYGSPPDVTRHAHTPRHGPTSGLSAATSRLQGPVDSVKRP